MLCFSSHFGLVTGVLFRTSMKEKDYKSPSRKEEFSASQTPEHITELPDTRNSEDNTAAYKGGAADDKAHGPREARR
jgi:hypothetical protein